VWNRRSDPQGFRSLEGLVLYLRAFSHFSNDCGLSLERLPSKSPSTPISSSLAVFNYTPQFHYGATLSHTKQVSLSGGLSRWWSSTVHLHRTPTPLRFGDTVRDNTILYSLIRAVQCGVETRSRRTQSKGRSGY
jgi:hypothetical protein